MGKRGTMLAAAAAAVLVAACQSATTPGSSHGSGTSGSGTSGSGTGRHQTGGATPSPIAAASSAQPVPKTEPPILIPGRFTGPAPTGHVLRLELVLKPGASGQTVAGIERVLAVAGMAVTTTEPGRVGFTASVAQAERLFDVHLQGYRTPGGTVQVVATSTPRLPASIAAGAEAVVGFYLPGQRRSGGRMP